MGNRRGNVTLDRPLSRVRKIIAARGIVRPRELERAGVSRTQLQRLVERGEVERLGRGLYTLAGKPRDERQDLAEAARRVPAGIVCLLSALRFHGLTTQDPFEVWMAVGHKAWRSRVDHPPLRLVFLTGRPLTEGIESHKVNGVGVRVFSAAKTVADCFKFRNKIGIDVTVEALRDYRRLRKGSVDELWRQADQLRMTRVIRPYWDAIAS